MTFDICPDCDGSGFRNAFEGSKCRKCNGLGVLEDTDPDDEEYEDYVSEDERKRNDAMERGDYLRDRAKDERGAM
jgi:DnaJ-class molecular chaperone